MLSLEERKVIAGRYRLERALARGGMGSVWVARHLQLEVDVAVKFMAPEIASSAEARGRFEREARASAQIKSPNVIQVHDYGVEDDTPFLVMELLEGEPLSARLERESRLSLEDTAAVLVPVCRALRHAHEMGLVHRDLKPDNIFLSRAADEVIPKVLDFGIAKLRAPGPVGSSTKTGALLGTPHYMSPEQVRKSSSVDHRSDLWSLGVIAFRCLTGELPFPGDEVGDVLVAICAEPIPRASDLAKDLGPDVDGFFERALARDVAQRFQSAKDLSTALATLAGELPPPSRVTSPPTMGDPQRVPPPTMGDPQRVPPPTMGDPQRVPQTPPDSAAAAPPASPPPPSAPAAEARDTAGDDRGDPPTPGPAVSPPASPPPRSRAGILALAGLLVAAAGISAVRSKQPGSTHAPSAAPVQARCASNHECAAQAGGRPAICRADDGACVPLESEDCRVLAGPKDAENDATLWIGAMFPAGAGDGQGSRSRTVNAMDLARRDFATTTGGLLPARPGGPKRPIGIVYCDDGSTAGAARAAQHLVDARIPAVIGFARSKEVLELAHSHFVPNGVLALASNMASSLRDIPRGAGGARLVWRISTNVDVVAPALATLLAEVVEPEMRGTPLRVTLVRGGNTTGQGYADLFVSTLRYNGRSVAENGDAFREVATDAAGGDPRGDRAADVVAHRPHVVIVAGASPDLIPAIERLWPAQEKVRPRYLVGGSLGHAALLAHAAEHADLRDRLLGVSTVKSTAALTKFVLHYNESFSPKVTVHDAESAPYDGVYLLAYAAAALGDKPITGSSLAAAFPRLLPTGDRIDVGPAGIYRALDALGAGKTIDLEGASTPLDLDPETGDAAADLAVGCLVPDHEGAHGAVKEIESGLLFRARTRKLEGARRCL